MTMKIRCLLALCLFTSMSFSVLAQEEEEEPKKGFDKDKLFISGNFGLSFGDFTLINISPQIGYRFNNVLAAGVGVNGIYSSSRSRFLNGETASRENYGVVGLNIFGRVYPIQYAFLQLQPEVNYTWGKLKEYSPDVVYKLDGKMVPSLLAGAGAAIPAGAGAFIIMAQYDVLQNARTPYGEKVFFSFGFNFGL
jgi:hypothetical protein